MRALFLILSLTMLLVEPALAGAASDGDKAAREGDWVTATAHYLTAYEAKPDDRTLLLKLADGARRTRHRDALDAARDGLLTAVKKNEKDWDAWVALGGVTLERARTMQQGTTIAMEYDDAKDFFQRVINAKPEMEQAHTGLAQVHRAQARADEAMAVIESYLKQGTKTQADALYWQGQLFYDRAVADFRAKGAVSDPAKQLFRKAQGAFQASAVGDPDNYDTWIKLAYSSAYLGQPGDVQTAQEAYAKALPLNLHSDGPMRGLASLLAHEKAKLAAVTAKLLKDNPKHPMLHYHVGDKRYRASDFAGAVQAMKVYTQYGNNPAVGNYYLGLCYQQMDKPNEAREAFLETLKGNPNHEGAAFQLDAPLREGGAQRASGSVKAAKKLIADYDVLLKIAPKNTLLLNNLAFTLREAHAPHKGDKSWHPILEACRDAYVKASEIIGPFDVAARNQPFTTRYGKAQIVSDTGLMFQFYPAIVDLEKAEEYYLQALEWSDDGYFDAWNNLCQIYNSQKRWQDLYDMAAIGAEKLVNQDGKPHPGRSRAQQLMKKLEADGLGD